MTWPISWRFLQYHLSAYLLRSYRTDDRAHFARLLGLHKHWLVTMVPAGQITNLVSMKHDLFNSSDYLNSLAPGKFAWNFRKVIFKQILMVDVWGISCETALIWMSLDFTDDQSTLVQVMAWCRQATSHYLSQCWPRSMSPNGITRLQWVKAKGKITIPTTKTSSVK